MTYAVFRHGRQVSKDHPWWLVAVMEAFERGLVVNTGRDVVLADGVEIRSTAALVTEAGD